MGLMIDGGVRPLSRKKARQLMWRNRVNLTGPALAAEHGRAPGYGRYKRRLMSEELRLQKEMEKEAGSKLEDFLRTKLQRVMSLLRPSRPAKERLREVRARANR